MGSSSSRHVGSAHPGPTRERQPRRKKDGVLVPLLRSLSCGSTSTRRAEGRVQWSPIHPAIEDGETLSCQNISGKALAETSCDDSPPLGIFSRDGKKLGHSPLDGSSSSSSSTIPSRSLECFKVSEKGRFLDGLSVVDSSNCSSSSSSSLACMDSSKNDQQWDLTESGVHSVMRDKRRSSFSEASSDSKIQFIDERSLLRNDHGFHQQVGSSDQGSPAGIPQSVGSQEHELHEITAADGYQRQNRIQDTISDVDGSPGEAETSENDYVSLGVTPLQSEPLAGSSMGSHETESVQTVVSNISRVNPEADGPARVNSIHGEVLDLISPSTGEPSSSLRGDVSGREARRNNRRRLWDAMTRVTSRRRTMSPTIVVASGEDIDGFGSSSNSWGLFDLTSGTDDESIADEGGFFVGRSVELEERRWRVRSQVWALQRLSGGFEGNSGHPRPCASGLHPDGRCSCEAYVMTEETNTRASISRIVMLAEALFEVLDEIHRQSVALSRSTSLSLVSPPAPDSVVDSFPLRIHKKSESILEEAAQCYICLVEYEDGDQVRILPCNHEYHMACVDKWLKEVHRVCPLCRGNVCEPHSGNIVPPAA